METLATSLVSVGFSTARSKPVMTRTYRSIYCLSSPMQSKGLFTPPRLNWTERAYSSGERRQRRAHSLARHFGRGSISDSTVQKFTRLNLLVAIEFWTLAFSGWVRLLRCP